MSKIPVADQLINAWNRHNEINLLLLGGIPDAGLQAVPLNSRGRTVARQFDHMSQVRLGWVHYHTTGKRPRRTPREKGSDPTRAELKSALAESGEAVANFLADAMSGEAKVRLFGGETVRWLAYLISHESHHRGQIMLALKQAGMKLPEKVAIQGLWGGWIFGKSK